MTELVTSRIQASATKLGLPHLSITLHELAKRADADAMSYLDFLDLVLQEELAVRDDRRFRAGLRLSKLPHHKTLDDYDFSFQPELDPRKIRELATLAFVQAHANVALLGPPVINGLILEGICLCRWGRRCDSNDDPTCAGY
ncbi:ATP-binding protein [Actinoplanes sp. NPDC049802]|uniref:ATP-binding protein n=1 Tax=Actinoplanes sp. NPDC049802 TaxID=3154742 RepID=UPI00340C9AA9